VPEPFAPFRQESEKPMLREPVVPRIVYPEDGSVRPVTRLVWRPVPAPPPDGRRLEELAGRRVVVLGDRMESVEGIAGRLRAHGAEVLTDLSDELLEDAATQALTAALGFVDGVIDLNVEDSWDGTADAWRRPLRRTVAVLKACYNDWIRETDCRRRFYVAVTSLGGTLGCGDVDVPQPLGGIWLGLAKTVPRELPNCNVRVLDVAPQDRAALEETLLDELYRWGLFEIGYRDGRRYMFAGAAESAPPPSVALDESDTVLVSGGSRGIGFALAQGLAGEFGCRVVVTGRSPLPSRDEPWLGLDAGEYKAYELGVLRAPPDGQTVAEARRGLERIRQLRELWANLEDVRRSGLPIEYLTCDFNDPAQTRALVETIGPSLTGVVHNASVSAPTRLPGKSVDSFFATVETKVGAFFRLFEAVSDRPLKFFCNVGSLVGRWGGMIGEIDYAAANAGLSIAGAWAARRSSFPVMTVCWPTWERLGGMIKNFDVTLNYTSALDVDEGVYRWKQELLGGTSGESVFVGTVGKAVFPVHLKGFPPIPDLANIGELYSHLHYLGEARRFEPFRAIESKSIVLADAAPCMHDVRVSGTPALPVSLLLEYALAVGGWVQPEPPNVVHWTGLRALEVDARALRTDDGTMRLVKRGAGSWRDGLWVVDVDLSVELPGGLRELATLELLYSKDEPRLEPEVPIESSGEPEAVCSRPPLTWGGLVYPPALWWRAPSGTLTGHVRPAEPSDIWATPFVPEAALPAAHLESILRAALWLQQPAANVARLRVARMDRFARTAEWGMVVHPAGGDVWSILADDGRTALQLRGLEYF
jgi:NAD(P)-dependent dehydrogenase (short-subunit alcohol dehydrogenase family)